MKKHNEKLAVEENVADEQSNAVLTNGVSRNIFALANRGMLLDIFVFLMNVFLMRWLTKFFWGIIGQALDGDGIAQFAVLIFFFALFILPPFGATLKRWHFHHRLQLTGKDSDYSDNMVLGCLCNPLFFFCLNFLIYAGVMIAIELKVYGDKQENTAVFAALCVFGMLLVAFQTFVVYRYFSPPKNPPRTEFFRSPLSELLGDASIYLNMILFQIIWNVITSVSYSTRRVTDIEEFFARLFLWSFIALLIYFPPRIFYLVEDGTRRRVWLTILLANLPVIFRVLIGTGSANW